MESTRWTNECQTTKKTAGNKIARSENNKGQVSLRYSINPDNKSSNDTTRVMTPFFGFFFFGRFAFVLAFELLRYR
jgi:hypothetical protein